MRRALSATLLAGLALACSRGEPRRSAILVTLDTTRADILGCYGGAAVVSPRLDELARTSLVFEAARSVAPLTTPSHASMLTGLWPIRHGVRDNGWAPLAAEALTIAERARESGVATAAFVSAAVLDAAYGLDQGFDVYDAPRPDPARAGIRIVERSAADTVALAREWLSTHDADEPFLLWVHVFDAHAPYVPDAAWLARTGGNAYAGEIAAADEALGGLFDDLAARGILDRALVVVCADHGEALGQHGEETHSTLVYEPTIRVPLVVRAPWDPAARGRSEAIASVVDVAPTIADALALRPLERIDGQSLLEPVADERWVYFESYCGFLNYGWSPLAGVADARGKYLASSASELVDPRADPRERNDLTAARADDVARYRSLLEHVASLPVLESGAPLSVEAVADVRALGYAGAGASHGALPLPHEASPLPAPRQRMPELRAYYAAIQASNAGRVGEAIESLQAITRDNPRNLAALDVLGALLVGERRFGEAEAALEAALRAGSDRATLHTSLALCKEQRGDLAGAVEHALRAAELRPGARDTIEAAARVLELAGRGAEAASWRAKLAGAHDTEPPGG